MTTVSVENGGVARLQAPRRLLALGLFTASALACSGNAAVPLRPEPIPYADTLPIHPPEERDPDEVPRLLRASVGGEIGRAFSLRNWLGARHEALNLTHFDDVVNSAWFEHRNGQRRMSPEEVARGPATSAPDTSLTLTVIAGKAAGISPGFTVRDAKGDTYLFKFDPKGNLHLASAADVISSRLFYAAGYHTPEDYIVVFDSARLALAPDAELDTETTQRAMNESDISAVLSLTDPLPDGRYLALASKFVPGRPLGPFFFYGVRDDDPNDHYRHEYRRELRGLYVVSSWLNHVDMRFANTLDAFIDPPGYVRHYLIDFAATLGSGTVRSHNPREGSEYNFDLWPTVARTFTLGFFEVGWEDLRWQEYHPAIGWMPVENFEPGAWKPNWPNAAFSKRTLRDNYWGAKLVGSFSDEQIAATVLQGGLPQEAAQILTRILIQRRDKVVAHWYARVTPIERPRASTRVADSLVSLSLSFDDLGIQAGIWEAAGTSYRWSFDDPALGVSADGEQQASSSRRQTLRLDMETTGARLRRTVDDAAPATLQVTALRPGAKAQPATIYLRWTGPDRGYQVVGITH